jgi:hypothetical protein
VVKRGCVFLPQGYHNVPQGYHNVPQGYSWDTKRNNEVSKGYPMANDTLRKEYLPPISVFVDFLLRRYQKIIMSGTCITLISRMDSLFIVLCPAQEYFTYMETSPLPVKDCKI